MSLLADVLTVVFGLCVITLYCYVAFRVARHARRRGSSHWKFHGIATLIFSLPYAGLYFIATHD